MGEAACSLPPSYGGRTPRAECTKQWDTTRQLWGPVVSRMSQSLPRGEQGRGGTPYGGQGLGIGMEVPAGQGLVRCRGGFSWQCLLRAQGGPRPKAP